jgi:hypothetical protein
VAALAIGAVLVLGACSSSGSSKSSTTNAGGSTAAATGGATGNTVKPPNGALAVNVDLVFTGDKPATIKGTKGRCDIPTDERLSSAYEFSYEDYPQLGSHGDVSVTGPQNTQLKLGPGVKAIINGSGFLDHGTGITVSADRKSVTLDADIGGQTSSGRRINEHVAGHITCS